ncbi:MAG: tetratricopeptide repeat protein [Flavobacteriaceae bacterium]|nr:tetratricopeptide repeat protein [Flavobacteriaceae bacterium]
MKKHYLFLFLTRLLIAISSCYGQNISTINNLEDKLRKEKIIDTSTVNILNDLAWEYNKTNFSLAIEYASRAIKISDSLSFYKGKTTGLNRLGAIYIYQKEFKKSEKIYLEVLEREKRINNQYGIGRAQNQLGEIYKNIGNLNLALDYTKKSFKNFKELKKENIVALVSSNLGFIYSELGLYELSAKSYHLSLDIRKQLKNNKGLAFTLLGLSTLYIKLEDYNKSIEHLNESERIFLTYNDKYELVKVYNNFGICFYELEKFNRSLFYYEKAQKLKKELGIESKDTRILNNIGALYHQKGNLDLALLYYQKSNLVKANIQTTLSTTMNMADIYYLKSNYLQSVKFYNKALEISKKSGYVISQLKILNDLSLCHTSLKEYKTALNYSNKYIILKNKIEKQYKEAVQTNARYKEIKNTQEITKINLEKFKADNQRKKTVIISLAIGLLLVMILSYLALRNRSQKEKIKLRDNQIKIKQQEIDSFLKSQEINAINNMLDLQEKERKRISEDLHDRIGSILSTVKMYFKSVEESVENLKKENITQYQKANELLDDACSEVRKISHDLGSGLLTKFGLVTALENLKDTLEKSKQISVVLITYGVDNRLGNDIELGVYRIVQELVSNVLKHAKAKEITIQLIKDKGILNIIIEDDGVGFNLSKEEDTGIGIINVKSRVDALNGNFLIDSTINIGTMISIDIPLS